MGRRDPVSVCKITKFSEWDNDVTAHRSRRPECPLQVSHEGMEEISKTSRLGNEASIQTQAVQSTDTVPVPVQLSLSFILASLSHSTEFKSSVV